MNLFFWMLLNLAVPIAGPIFTLELVAPAYGWRIARAMMTASVKDGQLFWCAIGLCAAAIYEAVTALEQGSRETSLLALWIVGFCGLAFACSIAVMAGLLKVQHERLGTAIGARQTKFVIGTFSRGAIRASIFTICLTALLFAALHIHLNQFFWIVQLLYLFCFVEELMKQIILSLEIGKNHDRIIKAVLIFNTLISIGMFALFLPGIFNR